MLHFSFFYVEESGQVFFSFFFNFPFFSVEAELDIVKANIRKKDQKDLDWSFDVLKEDTRFYNGIASI